ncbi:MAG TPA: MarR family transcriptional regulator [Candidatus Limiplasma sp.]|nr:MarR family transcriptional regulator [Candidatus Limiplasma sp.]HPS81700.1 MarR family transcriptional regulator [Candidatus Limiplasma sp.]
MDDFSRELNQLLVCTYRNVGKLEAGMLHSVSGMEVSIGELHLLEAIGESKDRGVLLCELAQRMELTPPTMTVAINKLALKGYVLKTKSTVDKRSVIVTLTRMGKKVNAAHRYFHEQMVRNIEKLLSPEEREGMLRGMQQLNAFFQSALGDIERKDDAEVPQPQAQTERM